jgi:lipopolysaccharide transport system permease protein
MPSSTRSSLMRDNVAARPLMHTVIKPRRGFARLDLGEVWRYRELLGFLAWRDVVIRYKQTTIGVLWAFLRPFLTMVIFTVVFSRIAKLPSEGVPYPVLTFAALLPWQFFATAFAEAANAIVGNGYMISKIYFPRLVLPLASVAVGTVDFFVSFLMLGALMLFYRVPVSPRVIALPLFLALCLVFTIGLGLWFAALYVKYRDMRHLIPFLTQFGLYVSPVAFSSSIVPAKWRLLYALNPMVAVIDGFRWSLLGTATLNIPGVVVGTAVSFALLITGVYYFKRTERVFADVM